MQYIIKEKECLVFVIIHISILVINYNRWYSEAQIGIFEGGVRNSVVPSMFFKKLMII